MEKNRFRSLVVALVLGLAAAAGAYAAAPETLPDGDAVLENAGGNACTAAAALAETPEAQMRFLIVPQPIPTYCTDCKPCTHKAQCGIDPNSGIYMGECWLAPSYCPGSSGTVCVCR